MRLRRRVFVLALLLAPGDLARARSQARGIVVDFDPGSAALDVRQRREIAEFARAVRDINRPILLSTEASIHDDQRVRAERIELVSTLLQADGIWPGRIRVELLDYDAIRKRLSDENARARQHDIPFGGWNLTQQDDVKVQLQ